MVKDTGWRHPSLVSPANLWGINKNYKSGAMYNFLHYCYEKLGYIYTLAQCLTMANPLKMLTIMIMVFSLI